MDSRINQTRTKLREAVLELARTRPPETISVSELTDRAGISRVTFYDHHKTVGELLVAVLAEELDRIRALSAEAREQASVPPTQHLPRVSIERVAEHVRQHREIYENALLSGADGVVERALRTHFETSLRGVPPPSQLPGGIRHRAAVRYTAYGMVGAISEWLEDAEGTELVTDDLTRTIAALQPVWWR